MTRKIKSKKYKGYKDPMSITRQKFEKIKNKINKTPSNPDVQEIPKAMQNIQSTLTEIKRKRNKASNLRRKRKKALHSLQNHIGSNKISKVPNFLKNDIQKLSKKIVKSKTEEDLINTADFLEKDIGWYPDNGKSFKPVPVLKQFSGESFFKFKQRVRAMTDTVIYESKFCDKYNVDVLRDNSGQVIQVLKKREEKMKEKRHAKEKKKDLKLRMKNQMETDVKQQENLNSAEDIDEMEKNLFRKDKIAFGDVVHQPPLLRTDKLNKLLKSKKEEKNYLFLQNLRKETINPQDKKPSQVNRREKRDLEAERTAAVQAYRQQKRLKTK